jgi:hypothetical protein
MDWALGFFQRSSGDYHMLISLEPLAEGALAHLDKFQRKHIANRICFGHIHLHIVGGGLRSLVVFLFAALENLENSY